MKLSLKIKKGFSAEKWVSHTHGAQNVVNLLDPQKRLVPHLLEDKKPGCP